MKLVIQRVAFAKVEIDGAVFSEIKGGLLVLVGVDVNDEEIDAKWLAAKTACLRIFNDADGVMNKSVTDIDGEILAVSQFTLLASAKKGNRPSYIRAARPEKAKPLYELYSDELERLIGKRVKRGCFGADMKVSLLNDGPVTILIDSRAD